MQETIYSRDGCVFRPAGFVCEKGPGTACFGCGWHPRIEDARKEQVREKLRQRARYLKKREEILAQCKAYRAAHREQNLAAQASYRERHREELREKELAYYHAHRDEINARRRAKRKEAKT